MIRAFVWGLLLVSMSIHAEQKIPLFNGISTTGWTPSGDIEWQVEQGAIVATGKGEGFLSTLNSYGDFHLKVEFWVDATTNSGIFIRCHDRDRIHPDTCYELNIWDHHPNQEARTGAIVFKAMPPLAQVETVDRWNTYEVLARGPHLEVRVNGEVTAQLHNADATAGFIALQHWEEGTVKFRSIEVTPY
jgi:hypothetical protein